MKKYIELFTDGACSGNPGPGGWASIVIVGGTTQEMSGGDPSTTNNRMELLGAIEGLRALKRPSQVELISDSKYLVDGMTKGWAKSWQAKGWVKSDKKPALNPDLWEELLRLTAVHRVEFHWIKGHAGHPYNERCDRLAVAQAERFLKKGDGSER